MAVSKITSKGQITIPQQVRKKLGVGPGDKVEFRELNGKFVVEKIIDHSPFDKYVGYLKKKRGREPDVIIEELRDS